MLLSRRGLLTGLVGLVAAPAIVRVSSLMPVKALPEVGEQLVIRWNRVYASQLISEFEEGMSWLRKLGAGQPRVVLPEPNQVLSRHSVGYEPRQVPRGSPGLARFLLDRDGLKS